MAHKRNKFNLSHKVNFSCDQGELIPISAIEVLPGDIFRHGTSLLIRLSPMLAPVFTQLNCTLFQFFVPNRLVWEDWEDFITGGEDGEDASVHPTIKFASGVAVGSLADYLGITPGVNNPGGTDGVSALPFRAYAKIFNDWIRDQDLQTEIGLSLASGVDTTTNTALQFINWQKDYFTSARPFEQKGPQITIPIGDEAPVRGIFSANAQTYAALGTPVNWKDTTGANPGSTPASGVTETRFAIAGQAAGTNVTPDIYADLAAVTGIPVTELRLALSLQRFEEISARYGSRYVEYILSRFGVKSSDARMQRSELLSRSKQVVQISEVLATAEGTDTEVGDLKGHGISGMRGNRYVRHFEEHGFVITLLAVQPTTLYPQGIHRSWLRRDKYDYFQQETQHVGQQEIYNSEIYAGAASPMGTFGWQDRFDDYRRMFSRVSGEFRTTALDFWHQARIFGSEPALNSTFVRSNPTDRIFAVPSEDNLYITATQSIIARRVMSAVGTSFIK